MKVIRVKKKRRIAVAILASWDFEFNIFMVDILLLEIHPGEAHLRQRA